uniref:Uncharacterized protein n=1 Tax=Nelumbo nucifera TaxID=4432 RepID=A0A822YTH8_NELNU|nr:TPA_asm: hypothetical protein HUJ06_006450 [Nelumbo nucifera]
MLLHVKGYVYLHDPHECSAVNGSSMFHVFIEQYQCICTVTLNCLP